MGNKTKKEEERIAWKAFIKHANDPLISMLSTCEDISSPQQERPDILLKSGNQIYGIEHISIPLIYNNGGNAARVEEAHIDETYNKYSISAEDGMNKLRGREHEALQDLENIINRDKFDVVRNFSHGKYIESCRKLLEKHHAGEYRKRIETMYPSFNIKLYFLLDIAYTKEFEDPLVYKNLFSNNKNEMHKYKDYPFTFAFCALLAGIKGVDRLFLIWHPYKQYEHKNTKCYVIDTSIDIMKQYKVKIWESFSLHPKYKNDISVKLNLKM